MSIDLSSAAVMSAERVTDKNGRWYLRSLITDDHCIQLVSATAPKGTLARDLVPDELIVGASDPDEAEDGVTLAVSDVLAFVAWPPS